MNWATPSRSFSMPIPLLLRDIYPGLDRDHCYGNTRPGVLRLDLPAGDPASFSGETEKRNRSCKNFRFVPDKISPPDLHPCPGFWGGQLAGGGDPLALLIRSLSLAVYPMFSYALGCFFDGVFAGNIPFITVSSEIICGFLKRTVLPFGQPFFLEGISIGLIFFLTLALNLREKRFWCKYLCPLEALLRMPFPSDLPGNRPLPPAILASGASSARCWQALLLRRC